MKSWRQSRVIAALTIGGIVMIQLVVPISRIGRETPQRFAWQMYSATEAAPEFTVTTRDGDTQIDLADYTAVVRADVPYDEFMLEHLCSVIPDAVSVTWEKGTFEC